MIVDLMLLGGSLLILVAAIGVIRFDDPLARMHSLTKASTLGVVIVLVGGAFGMHQANDVTFLVLAGALQVITSPVGANLISRATYRARGIPTEVDADDDLDVTGQ